MVVVAAMGINVFAILVMTGGELIAAKVVVGVAAVVGFKDVQITLKCSVVESSALDAM